MPPEKSIGQILSHAKKSAKERNWETAISHYQSVLARFPGNKRARQELNALKPNALPDLLKDAQASQNSGAWADAEHDLSIAAALAPDMPEIGLSLALCQLEMGKAAAALQAADQVLARRPGHPDALNAKGGALREMSRGAEAEACFLAALKTRASDPQTLNNLGILARAQGNIPLAVDYHRKAIALRPADKTLHHNLALSTSYSATEPHLEEMRALYAKSDQSDPATAPLCFALFKALDELDEREEAFSVLKKGNALTRKKLGYDFQKDAVPYALSKVLFKSPPEPVEEDTGLRPLLVTGLPRSGTTLVERILARAEGTQPCGELTVVQIAVGQLLRNLMQRTHKELTPEDIASLRTEVLNGYGDYSDGSPFLIDKMPLNFRWIGYVLAAVPEAKVLHVSRDPMAVAWSLYRYSLAGNGNAFIYDPSDIARFMALHRDLMTFWDEQFPGRIINLDYAQLVSDPEGVTKDLAQKSGLVWTKDWLTPERASNQVLTASSEQVRKPIYRGSDDGWRRYEAQLSDLSQALSSAGIL